MRFASLAIFLFAAFASAQEPSSYDKASYAAVAKKSHLVTFVGVKPRQIEGVVVARADKLEGYQSPCIVISRPDGDWLAWKSTLPSDATDEQIRRAVKPAAVPFGRSSADVEIGVSVEALDEVNAARARLGLRPLIRDDSFTAGALAVAKFRADRGIIGHTSNDFSFLPSGANAHRAGVAAWPTGMGWGSCCWDGPYTYAGAAWCVGPSGLRFMHIFVK